MNVCVLLGSLRRASFSGMLANALMSLAPSSVKSEVVEIGQPPFYNQDLERWIDPPPAPWATFRQRVKAVDAVLFVTPEHNRSVPAVLKNALDVGSRVSPKVMVMMIRNAVTPALRCSSAGTRISRSQFVS